MTKRIFRSILLSALAAVIFTTGALMLSLYEIYKVRMEKELQTEAGYIMRLLQGEQDEADTLRDMPTGNRITLISSDGKVLYDSSKKTEALDNHRDRPEIADAFEKGVGESARYSETLSDMTFYYAVRTDQNNVIRVSNTQSSVLGLLIGMRWELIAIIAIVILISFCIARSLSRRIVAPINALNLDQPLQNTAYDELSPLLLRMTRQREELDLRMKELTAKQREFAAVTGNMKEGLLILNVQGDVLSINDSAAATFAAFPQDCVGKSILAVNRSVELQSAVGGALAGESTETFLKLGLRAYRLLANPVLDAGKLTGIVLFVLDVTDRESAERSRREFTANVSHELKTPLTSISGYAEIMKDGLAKPEDMRRFAGRIYGEANRLIALVEDILRLSQLDEKAKLPEKQRIDLFAAAQSVVERLLPLAEKQGVALEAAGSPVAVFGIPKLLDEMLYNLAENAIKYNIPGGKVLILSGEEDKRPYLEVKDTGIGIAEEHQNHVFERFYRVDKSHSRATGGTGLGLSIVKHVASVHGAKISLKSDLGKGTTIRVLF